MPSDTITIRVPDDLNEQLRVAAEQQKTNLSPLIVDILRQHFAVNGKAISWPIADADLNLRGRLDELINEVIRIRMSLFGIAQYAQDGAFISKPWLESINAQCRELAPKTNYRTP
jgi:hypothetical protein